MDRSPPITSRRPGSTARRSPRARSPATGCRPTSSTARPSRRSVRPGSRSSRSTAKAGRSPAIRTACGSASMTAHCNRVIIGQLAGQMGPVDQRRLGQSRSFSEYQLASGVVVTDHLAAGAVTLPYACHPVRQPDHRQQPDDDLTADTSITVSSATLITTFFAGFSGSDQRRVNAFRVLVGGLAVESIDAIGATIISAFQRARRPSRSSVSQPASTTSSSPTARPPPSSCAKNDHLRSLRRQPGRYRLRQRA